MDNFLMSVAGVALAGFLIVSIVATFNTRRHRREAVSRLQFRPKKHLMVGVEKHCFQLLNEIFGQKFYIIPGVSLDALLSRKPSYTDNIETPSPTAGKLIDFVFCNKRTLRPVCAVKLDQRPISRDSGNNPKDMEKFFRSAHLPFVRITNPKKLNREAIIDEFSRVVYETSILDNEEADAHPRTKTTVRTRTAHSA